MEDTTYSRTVENINPLFASLVGSPFDKEDMDDVSGRFVVNMYLQWALSSPTSKDAFDWVIVVFKRLQIEIDKQKHHIMGQQIIIYGWTWKDSKYVVFVDHFLFLLFISLDDQSSIISGDSLDYNEIDEQMSTTSDESFDDNKSDEETISG